MKVESIWELAALRQRRSRSDVSLTRTAWTWKTTVAIIDGRMEIHNY